MCWSIEQKIAVSLLDQVVPITEIAIRGQLTDIPCPPSRIWILTMDEYFTPIVEFIMSTSYQKILEWTISIYQTKFAPLLGREIFMTSL